MSKNELWLGLNESARKALVARDYETAALGPRLAEIGLEARDLIALDRRRPEIKRLWIPGVEIFSRTIHRQAHRGLFGEMVRQDEGVLATIGLWPKQWSAARMFAHSAKGFHVHPPFIPAETTAENWHRRLFVAQSKDFSLRRYDEEQWDVMFFIQGRAEMILQRCAEGTSDANDAFFHRRRRSSGRGQCGGRHPAGSGACDSCWKARGDVIMVYGTSTKFRPEFEGRIASEVEEAALPKSWRKISFFVKISSMREFFGADSSR